MNNPFKTGDNITMNDAALKLHGTYRDCSKGTTYEVLLTGEDAWAGEPTAVSFKDDAGDIVISTSEHLTLAAHPTIDVTV